MRTGFLLLLSLFFTPLASAAPLSAEETGTLLRRLQEMRTKNPSLAVAFREERQLKTMAKPVLLEGRIELKAPDKFRREVRGRSPSETVCDGDELWIHYPNFKRAERYSLKAQPQVEAAVAALNAGLNFQRLEELFTVKAERSENGGWSVRLTPVREEARRALSELTVHLSAELEVEKTDYRTRNGDRVTTTYTDPRHEPIADERFVFTPPPGVEVTAPLGK